MKISEQHMAQLFGKTAASSVFGAPVKTVERLAELLAPGGSVLDLGAGDGRHALYLAEKGFQVKAVDLSVSGIEKLKHLAKESHLVVQTELADIAHYSISATYDAVVVVLLFQCLTVEASLRLIQEMKEHTAPEGINIVHVFTKTGDRFRIDQTEDPTAFYPEDGWLKEFYQDWEIVEYETSSGPLMGKFHEDGTPMTSVVERIVARKRI